MPPFQPILPIASLREVYTAAIQGCLVKIAQGFGASPSVSATFNAPDVKLYWVAPEYGTALNYEMLLQLFHSLVNLNVRETSPFPNLIGKDFSFVVVDRADGSHMGDGIIMDTRVADSEILAKRSVDPSSAPELLQPLASQQPSTTAILRSKYVQTPASHSIPTCYTAQSDLYAPISALPAMKQCSIVLSHRLPTTS